MRGRSPSHRDPAELPQVLAEGRRCFGGLEEAERSGGVLPSRARPRRLYGELPETQDRSVSRGSCFAATTANSTPYHGSYLRAVHVKLYREHAVETTFTTAAVSATSVEDDSLHPQCCVQPCGVALAKGAAFYSWRAAK